VPVRSPIRRYLTLLFVVLLAIFGFAPAPGAAEKLESFTVSGEKYISLPSWAKSRSFTFRWDQPAKLIHLTNRWARITFNLNSKKAALNGTTLWLSHPVLARSSGVGISDRDLQKTLLPILYPEKLPAGRSIRTIMLAAGHGGKDPGYQINQHQEKKYTLLMAQALKQSLAAAGFRVLMTRETDLYIHPEQQAAKASRAKADLFITLHYNAISDTAPNGIETYALTPPGAIATNGGTPSPRSPGNKFDAHNALLAYQAQKFLLQNTQFEDRGLRRAGFLVLRELTMPGILIEGGFLSNPADARRILSASERKKAAQAITDAVLAFKRQVERQ